MEVIRETFWKRCLSTPTKPPAKNSNICLSETAYQHKGTRKKCKKTNQAAIIQWQRQCLMDKPHRKPWPKSKTSEISKSQSTASHLFARKRSFHRPTFISPDYRECGMPPKTNIGITGLRESRVWVGMTGLERNPIEDRASVNTARSYGPLSS